MHFHRPAPGRRPKLLLVHAGPRGVVATPSRELPRAPLRWRRPVPDPVTSALARWADGDPDELDTIVDLDLDSTFACLPQLDDPRATRWFHEDVASLARRLGVFAGERRLRLVLGVVRGDRCRKFHVDRVRMRLITTYLGPGTEWIGDEDVDRGVLASPPLDVDEANRRILREGGRIHRAERDEILLLRGERGPAPDTGTVHRSPSIAAAGLVRVVMSLTAGSPRGSGPADRGTPPERRPS